MPTIGHAIRSQSLPTVAQPLLMNSTQVRLIDVPVPGFRSRVISMSDAAAEGADVPAMFDRYKERLRRTVRLRLDRRLADSLISGRAQDGP